VFLYGVKSLLFLHFHFCGAVSIDEVAVKVFMMKQYGVGIKRVNLNRVIECTALKVADSR
jgi:hypothetical protein